MIARARLSWLSILSILTATASPTVAAPFQSGNLVISRPSGAPPTVAEYTTGGVLVQSVSILAGSGGTRGSGVDVQGRLHVQVGSLAPSLFTWDRATDAWSSRAWAGWSSAECSSCGGLGLGAEHVYATDVVTAGTGAPNGLIRFDAAGGGAQRFAAGTDYSDVTVGGDALIYARRADRASTVVDVFDPANLAPVRSVSFAYPCVAFEADEAGNLFGVFGVSVVRFAPTGAVLGGRSLPVTGSLLDLSRSADGRLAVSSSSGQVLILDALGNVLQTFVAGSAGHLSFVPEFPVPVVCTDSIGPARGALAAAREQDPSGATCVRASWTAPADSTLATGERECIPTLRAAASYDLRWSASPIETEEAFAAANAVDGEPTPADPGVAESALVCGVPEDVELHVALRSLDADGNLSAIATVRIEAVPRDTVPVDRPCPQAWSHWQNTSVGWPDALVLGELSYSSSEARALLDGVQGDASLVLARSLVAAKLNRAAGADPAPVADAVAEADAAIGARRLPIGVDMNSNEGRAMRDLAKRIEDYNKGKQTPGCNGGYEDTPAFGRIARNPFGASASVALELSERAPVRVVVFDLQGRVCRVLADAEWGAGSHVVTWDGADANGVRVPRGVYLIRAMALGAASVRKVVVGSSGVGN